MLAVPVVARLSRFTVRNLIMYRSAVEILAAAAA